MIWMMALFTVKVKLPYEFSIINTDKCARRLSSLLVSLILDTPQSGIPSGGNVLHACKVLRYSVLCSSSHQRGNVWSMVVLYRLNGLPAKREPKSKTINISDSAALSPCLDRVPTVSAHAPPEARKACRYRCRLSILYSV